MSATCPSIHLPDHIATPLKDIYHLLSCELSLRWQLIKPIWSGFLCSPRFFIHFLVHQEMVKYAQDLSGQSHYGHVGTSSGSHPQVDLLSFEPIFLEAACATWTM